MENPMECTKENKIKMLKCKKKFFLKSFVISLVLLILSAFACITFHESCAGMAEKMYGIAPHYYSLMVGMLFGLWKILIIQFTLVPFIALACMQKHVEKCAEKNQ